MEIMKMNNLLKNILMGIFAVMLLTSTLTLGVQNGINIANIEDRVEEQVSILPTLKTENDDVKLGNVHPIIQIAEATKEIDNEIESEEDNKNIDYDKADLESNSLEPNSDIGTDPKPTLSQDGNVNEV